jgi:hypothetical protein
MRCFLPPFRHDSAVRRLKSDELSQLPPRSGNDTPKSSLAFLAPHATPATNLRSDGIYDRRRAREAAR